MGVDSLPVAHISGEQAIALLQTTIAVMTSY
jgi:hypothetical protein